MKSIFWSDFDLNFFEDFVWFKFRSNLFGGWLQFYRNVYNSQIREIVDFFSEQFYQNVVKSTILPPFHTTSHLANLPQFFQKLVSLIYTLGFLKIHFYLLNFIWISFVNLGIASSVELIGSHINVSSLLLFCSNGQKPSSISGATFLDFDLPSYKHFSADLRFT